ncbi:MAG: biotin--[acetyl-CoA-carboxylase] ligase [Phormidesmis sp.]
MEGAELGISPEFQRIRPRFDVHVFESLPSTNTRLWQMMAQGAIAGTVAIAQRQSSGRGQHGRVWQSEPGGLYLSLALEPDWPVSDQGQLTSMSAWGIAIALNNLGLPIKIKWPNDLFFEGKKLGGILTETKLAQPTTDFASSPTSAKSAPRIKQAVIGVGINWHNPIPKTAITLAKILELMPKSAAQNKINCLEVLIALVLRGILQGYFFQQRVSNQVFMKAHSNLLIRMDEFVSLDSGFERDYPSRNVT